MSEIRVDNITDEAGTGRPAFSNGVQTSNINGGQVGGRRNLIINGAMQVAQRGTSTSGVTSSGYYACDRWKLDSLTEDTVTISQSTDSPDGFSNSLKLEVTSADSSFDSFDYAAFTHAFEGQDLQNLAFGSASAKSLILSFWVKSTVAGTYAIQLQHQDSNLYYCKTYNINSVNTWENKTITIDGNTQNSFDNDSNRSANLWFIMTAGSGYTGGTEDQYVSNSNDGSLAGGHNVNLSETVGNEFYLTGVQLEVGDTATEFEHRSYGEELALCQRYYEKTIDPVRLPAMNVLNTKLVSGPLHFTTKRTTPSITINGTSEIIVNSGAGINVDSDIRVTNTSNFFTLFDVFGTTRDIAIIAPAYNGSLEFDAEL